MKYLYLYRIALLSVFAFQLVFAPRPVAAQVDKSCTADAQCLGPGGVCVQSPLGFVSSGYSGGKNCRNTWCSASSVVIVDADGKATNSNVLRPGQKARITLNSNTNVTEFIAAMYNIGNPYPTPPDSNPKEIRVPKAHLDKFGQPAGVRQQDGNYHLIYSSGTVSAKSSHTLEIPWEFFIVKDQNVNNANQKVNQIATRIQVNGYFGNSSTKQFSLPEARCVVQFTVDASSVQCTSNADCTGGKVCSENFQCTDPTNPIVTVTQAPAAGNCPANSSCNAGNICSCNTGYNNCDNNWANGCEVQGRCQAGGVCTSGSQCQSGICRDRICVGNAEPTRVPAGGSCQDNEQCQNGYICQNNRCFPVYCDANRPCPEGYSCKQGVCFPPQCNDTDARCPSGYTCDAATRVCQPVGSCRADTPCAPGYYCDTDGRCKKNDGQGSCRNEADCKANGQCINGQCFCKTGTYNCDRDWANGCEASTPCQGSGAARVTLKVKFNGIGVNVPPVKPSIRVKIGLANRYLTRPVYQTVDFVEAGRGDRNIMTYQGSADFSNIPFGNEYSIFVKGDHHLQKRICDNAPTEVVDGRYYCTLGKITIQEGENTFDFTKIYMLAGDLPVGNVQDGFIDSIDATVVRSNLGSKEQNILDVADLNLDGIVDAQDFRLIMAALEFKYDEEVTGLE
ncbi:MAG: hypothetical protein N2691_02800 [Patescibacteria group bacterium]|nr:hypothetical protein [Patescibacteria group bacterium]